MRAASGLFGGFLLLFVAVEWSRLGAKSEKVQERANNSSWQHELCSVYFSLAANRSATNISFFAFFAPKRGGALIEPVQLQREIGLDWIGLDAMQCDAMGAKRVEFGRSRRALETNLQSHNCARTELCAAVICMLALTS